MSTNANFGCVPTVRKISNVDFAKCVLCAHSSLLPYGTILCLSLLGWLGWLVLVRLGLVSQVRLGQLGEVGLVRQDQVGWVRLG